MEECEYCGRLDVVLYAFHADIWCGECLESSNLPQSIPVSKAVVHGQKRPAYDVPAIWQTPDRSVLGGRRVFETA